MNDLALLKLIEEIQKCKSFSYFTHAYMGGEPVEDFQQNIIEASFESTKKYILWSTIFHQYSMSAVLSINQKLSYVMCDEMLKTINELPTWMVDLMKMQPKIKQKMLLQFENQSRVLFRNSNPRSLRGLTLNTLAYSGDMQKFAQQKIIENGLPGLFCNKGKLIKFV